MENLLFLMLVFFTNIIQSVTGFAGTLLAMPASILLIGINEARAVLNVLGLLSSVWIVLKDYHYIRIREFIKITVLMALGAAAGLLIMSFSDLTFLLKLYGIFIIAVALKKLFVKGSGSYPQWAMILTLVCAGAIHGMFISGGSLLVIYAAAVLKDKTVFRSTLSAVWICLNSLLLITHIHSGFFTSGAIRLTLGSIPPLLLALLLGTWLHRKVNQQTFLTLTYILLIISGILILR